MKQEVYPDNLFYPDILDHMFLTILFQIINVLRWIYNANEKSASFRPINEYWASSSNWLKMNGVEHTDVQMNFWREIFV